MKKIMFNDRMGLTDAVLSGLKTQTRRFVPEKFKGVIEAFEKPVLIIPIEAIPDNVSIEEFCEQFAKQEQNVIYVRDSRKIEVSNSLGEIVKKTCRYKIDEIIAIAQRYEDIMPHITSTFPRLNKYTIEESAGYTNKMYVDSLLMPHRIKITNVRIERLQDISEEDCMKEGIVSEDGKYSFNDYESFCTAKDAFRVLINRINGKGTWEMNPLVFVYEFKLIK